jgi:hypothetical protein
MCLELDIDLLKNSIYPMEREEVAVVAVFIGRSALQTFQ